MKKVCDVISRIASRVIMHLKAIVNHRNHHKKICCFYFASLLFRARLECFDYLLT